MTKRVREVNGFKVKEEIFGDVYSILVENLTSGVLMYIYMGDPLTTDYFNDFCSLLR